MAIKVPNIFSRERQMMLMDKGREDEATALARRRQQYKQIERQKTRANPVRRNRLSGKQMGLVQRGRDAIVDVRDKKRLEKQSEVRQDYLGVVGQIQANQLQQFNVLAKNLEQANQSVRAETRRQTDLYSQILAEQQEFQRLAEARANREQSLAQFQEARLGVGIAQQQSLARGRVNAARSRRQNAPTRTLSLG